MKRTFTAQFKQDIARRLHAGESPAVIKREHKLSDAQIYGWKKKYPPGEETDAPFRTKRRERIPIPKQKLLTFAQADDEYVYRGVVEDDRRVGRVEQMKTAGWEPVTEGHFGDGPLLDAPAAPGKTVSRVSGQGSVTYLMRKRRDEYEEDMEIYEDRNKKMEEAIFGELDKEGRTGRIRLGQREEIR